MPAASHQLKTTGGWQWAWPAAPLSTRPFAVSCSCSDYSSPWRTSSRVHRPQHYWVGPFTFSTTSWKRQEIPPQDEKQGRRAGRQASTSPSGCHETLWQSIKVAVKVESGVGARRRDQAVPRESRWKRPTGLSVPLSHCGVLFGLQVTMTSASAKFIKISNDQQKKT